MPRAWAALVALYVCPQGLNGVVRWGWAASVLGRCASPQRILPLQAAARQEHRQGGDRTCPVPSRRRALQPSLAPGPTLVSTGVCRPAGTAAPGSPLVACIRGPGHWRQSLSYRGPDGRSEEKTSAREGGREAWGAVCTGQVAVGLTSGSVFHAILHSVLSSGSEPCPVPCSMPCSMLSSMLRSVLCSALHSALAG